MIYTNTFNGTPVQPANSSFLSIILNDPVTNLNWPLIYQESPNAVANYIGVISNGNFNYLVLPDCTLVSTGQAIIIQNVGSDPFIVQNLSGVDLLTISDGQAYYLVLASNLTQDGVWITYLFGSGTTTADAAALAGYGLQANLTKLNTNYVSETENLPYSVSQIDRAKLIVWEGGTDTITLPLSSSSGIGNGFYVAINNNTTVGGIVSVVGSGTETIDNLATFTLNPAESATFISDGAGHWNTLGYGNNSSVSFQVNTITATGGIIVLTEQEAERQIQIISGTLTSDLTIQVPSISQQYYVVNATSGSFSLNFVMSGQLASNFIPQQTSSILYCDGGGVYFAQTCTYGQLLAFNGTAADPSISFNASNLDGFYSSGVNSVGLSLNTLPIFNFQSNYLDMSANTIARQGEISSTVLTNCYF